MGKRLTKNGKAELLFDTVIEQVPTLPFVVTKLLEVTESDTSSAEDLRNIIEADQALAAKILKLANAAFYGRSGSTSNIRDAIVLIGFSAVKNIALSVSVKNLFDGEKDETGFDLPAFWLHSLACAMCAKDISQRIRAPFGAEAFVSGMLHDIGKAILNQHLPKEYKKTIQCVKADKMTVSEAEEKIFGVDHAVVGSWLLKIWKFPKLLSDAARFHHQYMEEPLDKDPQFRLAAIANLSDTIVHIQQIGSGGDEIPRDMNNKIVKRLGLTEDDVNRIATDLHEKVWDVANSMGFSAERRTHFEILLESNRKLRGSETKYRSLVANIPDVTWTADREGNTSFISPNVEEVYRYSPEEIYRQGGHVWLERIHHDDIEKVREAYRTLFEEGTRFDVEYRTERKDGEWIWLHNRSIATYEKGGILYADGVFSDVTRRKQAEEQIELYSQQLAEQNKELKLQTQKALEASRLKSEFLANMSHEIRTPLNAIMGFAQIINSDSDDPLRDDQEEYLGYILSSGENLLGIINDILDLSKIEAGKITLENAECSLREIVSELHKMLKQRAEEKQIDLRISYGEGISDHVVSDPTRLRQILLNLIGNAIKFTDKGYVEIGVQKGNNFPDYFEFYVRDTGIGIPQEKIKSIFNPFEQVDGSMTRKYGGTGLGLAIVDRLIGLMGGEIKVVAQSGKGSTFYFEIPYKPVQGSAERLLKTEETETYQVSNNGRKCILVAEDNDLNYKLIEILLTKHGFDILRAQNGEDAISIYKTKRGEICLILMDVHMPVLGGLEATKVIRKSDGKVPIIAFTAHAMKGDRERTLDAGCTDYVAKPINPAELFEKIEQCISIN